MPDHPNQPQQYDAVLGEQTPIRAGSAILGGLEGVNRHLDSAVEEQRIAALSEALKYGEAGLDLVIRALQDESEKLQRAAYLLLRERTEPKVKQTLWEGVKRHLDSAVEEQRIAALSEALKYGEAGLDLVILALQDDSEKLQRAAYLLLRERTEPKVKQTLKDYNPWQFVTCLHTLLHPPLSHYERWHHGDSVAVRSVAISRDGQTLVSAGGDYTIRVWHIPTGQLTRTLGGDLWLHVAISPDGQTLVSANNGTIQVWHLPTGQVSRILKGHSANVYRIAISPDGQTLVSGSHDGTIHIWHLPTGELIRTLRAHSHSYRPVIRTLRGHSGSIKSVAISRDGQTLVSCSTDHTIKIWHLPTGQLTRTLEEDGLYGVSSVAVSPGGQTVVSAGGRDGLKVSNLSMSPIGQMTRTLGADPFRCSVVAISPDGETLVSDSTDHTIKIWHLPTGQLITTLVGHSDLVTFLAISQDGQTFVSGSKDGTIKVWGVP
jgi:WD40 repeat protein